MTTRNKLSFYLNLIFPSFSKNVHDLTPNCKIKLEVHFFTRSPWIHAATPLFADSNYNFFFEKPKWPYLKLRIIYIYIYIFQILNTCIYTIIGIMLLDITLQFGWQWFSSLYCTINIVTNNQIIKRKHTIHIVDLKVL